MEKPTQQALDTEWVDLILDALETGLHPTDIKEYFNNALDITTQKHIEDDCNITMY